jgi:hypothetical protein
MRAMDPCDNPGLAAKALTHQAASGIRADATDFRA